MFNRGPRFLCSTARGSRFPTETRGVGEKGYGTVEVSWQDETWSSYNREWRWKFPTKRRPKSCNGILVEGWRRRGRKDSEEGEGRMGSGWEEGKGAEDPSREEGNWGKGTGWEEERGRKDSCRTEEGRGRKASGWEEGRGAKDPSGEVG